jgi:orotidine-5'-phosphate decarboxylase
MFSATKPKIKNPVAIQLQEIMDRKKTNLCVAADVDTKKELLELADAVGPYICVLKTHHDAMDDFDQDTIVQLQLLAARHGFIIFEDRKFADIGSTVHKQYTKGYRIADWSPITNAHCVPGPGIIDGLRIAGMKKGNCLLLLAEMSSKDNLANAEYTSKVVAMAEQNEDFVIGFIGQRRLGDKLVFTPGVQFVEKSDSLGQQYKTPEEAVANGADVIIVGRGIYANANPAAEARRYQEAGYQAYLKLSGQPAARMTVSG